MGQQFISYLADDRCLSVVARWKVHEATLYALGSVKSLILELVEADSAIFNLTAFFQEVILADLSQEGQTMSDSIRQYQTVSAVCVVG